MHSVLIGLGVLLAACGGGDQNNAVDAPGADAPGAPTLAVAASPTTVMRGETTTFTLTLENFKIVNPNTATMPKPGEGHYHWYLDDAPNYTAAWTPTVAFKPGPLVALGAHSLRFVLVTSAHEPIEPLVESTVMFTVQ